MMWTVFQKLYRDVGCFGGISKKFALYLYLKNTNKYDTQKHT
jgi:hypothetical protein